MSIAIGVGTFGACALLWGAFAAGRRAAARRESRRRQRGRARHPLAADAPTETVDAWAHRTREKRASISRSALRDLRPQTPPRLMESHAITEELEPAWRALLKSDDETSVTTTFVKGSSMTNMPPVSPSAQPSAWRGGKS